MDERLIFLARSSDGTGRADATRPPHIAPARGPPLQGDCGDGRLGEGAQIEPDWDLVAQPAPDYEVDQRINW